MSQQERRRAQRIEIDFPTQVEPIGQPAIALHENLEAVYSRVMPATERLGHRIEAVVRDISTNGCFVSGEALPLLSRVAFQIDIEGYGPCNALGWVLWRRDADCEIPIDDGGTLELPMGFGVLFEAIPIDARIAILKLVKSRSAGDE